MKFLSLDKVVREYYKVGALTVCTENDLKKLKICPSWCQSGLILAQICHPCVLLT